MQAQRAEIALAANGPAPRPQTTSVTRISRRVELPPVRPSGEFAKDLLQKTNVEGLWRRLSSPSKSTSTPLDLSFGVQSDGPHDFGEDVMLKTSPSPGRDAFAAGICARPRRGRFRPRPRSVHQRLMDSNGSKAASPPGPFAFSGPSVVVRQCRHLGFLTGVAARIQHRYSHAPALPLMAVEAGQRLVRRSASPPPG